MVSQAVQRMGASCDSFREARNQSVGEYRGDKFPTVLLRAVEVDTQVNHGGALKLVRP